MLDNLLDNAIRAAPTGTTVTTTLTIDGSIDAMSVADEGGGLTDDEKPLAMKRFWRSDDSQPGTGLGLSIVDSIARASRGAVALADNDPTGLVVTVTLPIAVQS